MGCGFVVGFVDTAARNAWEGGCFFYLRSMSGIHSSDCNRVLFFPCFWQLVPTVENERCRRVGGESLGK